MEVICVHCDAMQLAVVEPVGCCAQCVIVNGVVILIITSIVFISQVDTER